MFKRTSIKAELAEWKSKQDPDDLSIEKREVREWMLQKENKELKREIERLKAKPSESPDLTEEKCAATRE